MKKIFLFLVAFLMLAVATFAQQSNTILSWNPKESNDQYTVYMAFNADSTGTAILSNQFSWGGLFNAQDFYTVPITFNLKIPGETGVPRNSIVLLGYFGADTVALDTLRALVTNQTQGDTTGQLTLNALRAPAYGLKIINIDHDVLNGQIWIVATKRRY